jgi:hypothetical protein
MKNLLSKISDATLNKIASNGEKFPVITNDVIHSLVHKECYMDLTIRDLQTLQAFEVIKDVMNLDELEILFR